MPDQIRATTDNAVMDAAELARITATLVAAIAEAKVRAKAYGIDPEFREIVPERREPSLSDRRLTTAVRRAGCGNA